MHGSLHLKVSYMGKTTTLSVTLLFSLAQVLKKGLLHHSFTEFPFHVASVHKTHVHLNCGWAYRQVG